MPAEILPFLFILYVCVSLQDMDFASHYEFFKMNDIKDISSSKPPFGRYRDRRSADMLHAKYASETTKKLNFTLFKRSFILHMILDVGTLAPDVVFIESSHNHSRQLYPFKNNFWLYRAFVQDEPRSLVSQVSLSDHDISAIIRTRNETYFLEPLSKNEADLHYAYKLSDVKDENTTRLFCRIIERMATPPQPQERRHMRQSHFNSQIQRDPKVCTLALTADINFFRHKGRSNIVYTFKYLINLIAKINVIFSGTTIGGESGYNFAIKQIKILKDESGLEDYNSLNGKFSDSVFRKALKYNDLVLEEIDSFGIEHLLVLYSLNDWSEFCLSHLFTHLDFESVIGLAFAGKAPNYGGICSPCKYLPDRIDRTNKFHKACLNVALTSTYLRENNTNDLRIHLITAHELGHNFGALHDSLECMAPKALGGNYLMHPNSPSGRYRNNMKFSNCSLRAMSNLVNIQKERCFIDDQKFYCGDGLVEGEEECDDGQAQVMMEAIGKNRYCCSKKCQLIKGAKCSPYNSNCCDENCQIKPKGVRCRKKKKDNCIAEAFCDGFSVECPKTFYLPDHSVCLNKGFCWKGRCRSRCDLIFRKVCQCKDKEKQCYLCCFNNKKKKCERFVIKDSPAHITKLRIATTSSPQATFKHGDNKNDDDDNKIYYGNNDYRYENDYHEDHNNNIEKNDYSNSRLNDSEISDESFGNQSYILDDEEKDEDDGAELTNVTDKYIMLADRSICSEGQCFKGKCVKLKSFQMISIRTWDVIKRTKVDFLVQLIRSNLVLLVFFLVFIPYLFVSLGVCWKDHKTKMRKIRLKEWYAMENAELFVEGSTVNIRNR